MVQFLVYCTQTTAKIIPEVASIDETIKCIVEGRYSVSRFGDGELLLTNPNKEIGFQKGDTALAQRLTEVLTSHDEGHLVCISDAFTKLYRYNRKARRFWRTHFFYMAHGGTICWYPTALITIHLSPAPIWTLHPKMIAGGGFTT